MIPLPPIFVKNEFFVPISPKKGKVIIKIEEKWFLSGSGSLALSGSTTKKTLIFFLRDHVKIKLAFLMEVSAEEALTRNA